MERSCVCEEWVRKQTRWCRNKNKQSNNAADIAFCPSNETTDRPTQTQTHHTTPREAAGKATYMSRNVNWPRENRSIISGCLSRIPDSFATSINPSMSPIPRSRLTNDFASNTSRSSKCSPVPMNAIGAEEAPTAESAPPPFAPPSSFDMMHEPTSTVAANASAWSDAAWPMVESRTKITFKNIGTSRRCARGGGGGNEWIACENDSHEDDM